MQFARDTDGEMNHPLCIPIIWKKERLQLYTPLQHVISAQRQRVRLETTQRLFSFLRNCT